MSFAASPLRTAFALLATGLGLAAPRAANAQEIKTNRYYELETKYIFGFTNGTDIGAEGEKEIELETTGAFRKRAGRYNAIEQEIEFEYVPTQYWGNEFSAHFLSQQITNVPGLDNLSQTGFSGLSWKPKWLIVGRGPGNPFGLSLSVQPAWERLDGGSGAHTSTFSFATRLAVDTEIIPNMFYGAVNLFYAPEMERAAADFAWSRVSTYGASGALAYRVAPKVTLGGEAEVNVAYGGWGLGAFSGSALFIGPTLHIQVTPKIFLAAAWSVEVSGHASGDPGRLDLDNFERQRANLKMGLEF
ncbi:hypothetical protein [uncultured Rhodoblastus sp.]|uniref:hypothetical protein n=1 Tax=uncultured Rhodoblastus sp. TaxID=543037 RepID=UPI0025DBE84A|nr:hypothetical protein [uncultured Rhodoblastus sp.]